MVKPAGLLTAEERARITEIQDVLIDLFVEHREAVENGENRCARYITPPIAAVSLTPTRR